MCSKITQDSYFILFPTCIPVKGYAKSIIMDLDKSAYLEIPNLLFEILTDNQKGRSLPNLKKIYDNELDEGIDDYFKYLEENQYGFFTTNPEPFKKPEKVFYSPYKIISSVIAMDEKSNYNLIDVLKQLDEQSCQIVQIRIYNNSYEFAKLCSALNTINESSIRIVELFLPFSDHIDESQIMSLVETFKRAKITVHGSPINNNISSYSDIPINYTKNIISNQSKEIYDKKLFTISYNMYYESLFHNSGLFRKVCIDEKGQIKNYLSHDKIYGNVKKDTLIDIIERDDFQEKYNITNDTIKKCKDCQYRYMCLSNSDFKFENNMIEKINTCTFNPYKNSWNQK